MRRVGFSFAKCFYGTRTWSGLGFLASTCLEISSSRSNGTVLRAVPIGDGTAPSGGNVAFLIRSPSGDVAIPFKSVKTSHFVRYRTNPKVGRQVVGTWPISKSERVHFFGSNVPFGYTVTQIPSRGRKLTTKTR